MARAKGEPITGSGAMDGQRVLKLKVFLSILVQNRDLNVRISMIYSPPCSRPPAFRSHDQPLIWPWGGWPPVPPISGSAPAQRHGVLLISWITELYDAVKILKIALIVLYSIVSLS